jgi:hypothetical protein
MSGQGFHRFPPGPAASTTVDLVSPRRLDRKLININHFEGVKRTKVMRRSSACRLPECCGRRNAFNFAASAEPAVRDSRA